MKTYYRVMLGHKSSHAGECVAGKFIGVDFGIAEDLTGKLPDEWREFNRRFIPVIQARIPAKTRVGAGLACGFLWTVAKGINRGDIVLCPDGSGHYHVAEVTGEYFYVPGEILPHRRPVQWLDQKIDRSSMSEALQLSTGSSGTVAHLKRPDYAIEIEKLIQGIPAALQLTPSVSVEDPAAFAMEMHLEEFLVKNWAQTDLGKEFDIYSEDGEVVGQQYETDTGPLDILAISKDKKSLLVVELKRGRASDSVVGQILRYMSFVQEQLAEEGQTVKGVIIALDDDTRIRRALAMVPAVGFSAHVPLMLVHPSKAAKNSDVATLMLCDHSKIARY
jgi:restriction system protein